jgi:hypothetical protein
MVAAEVVAVIGRMPSEFCRRSNVSMVQLLKESGYLSNVTAVTVQLLQEHFRSHADDLAAWVRKSEDNRSAPAWFITPPNDENRSSKWAVGYFPGNQLQHYEHGHEACAIYVMRWLEQTSELITYAS